MANMENGKKRLLALREILLSETDAKHGLTAAEIIKKLEDRGYSVERKALYRDFEVLSDSIALEKGGKPTRYYVEYRDFELEEIMILIDAVESAGFMKEKKKAQMIRKLRDLTSTGKAAELSSQIHYLGRHHSKNNDVLYSTAAIRRAMTEHHPVTFQYTEYALGKGEVLRKNGMKYILHPYALAWNNGFYYCIGVRPEQSDPEEKDKVRHFRIDRMKQVQVDEKTELQDPPKGFDVASYIERTVNMYGASEPEKVLLRFKKELLSQFYDRFDQKDTVLPDPKDPDYLTAYVTIHVSPTFFSWVSQYAGGFTIAGPEKVRKEYHRHLKAALEA